MTLYSLVVPQSRRAMDRAIAEARGLGVGLDLSVDAPREVFRNLLAPQICAEVGSLELFDMKHWVLAPWSGATPHDLAAMAEFAISNVLEGRRTPPHEVKRRKDGRYVERWWLAVVEPTDAIAMALLAQATIPVGDGEVTFA